ncbi:hypothetical protein C5167_033642 [Papaver somniferum]|uniref:Uncharacterized protein n=1 Tax=Papaver somniferum TaxID=3469 RepID=A0A4Y7KDA8_PAPSO|nr:hypothetical protein C5167_033642 [Papaver somniferum]
MDFTFYRTISSIFHSNHFSLFIRTISSPRLCSSEVKSGFRSEVEDIFLKRNDAGDHFPSLEICLGFELLSTVIREQSLYLVTKPGIGNYQVGLVTVAVALLVAEVTSEEAWLRLQN